VSPDSYEYNLPDSEFKMLEFSKAASSFRHFANTSSSETTATMMKTAFLLCALIVSTNAFGTLDGYGVSGRNLAK
jgi:hypothetical protein